MVLATGPPIPGIMDIAPVTTAAIPASDAANLAYSLSVFIALPALISACFNSFAFCKACAPDDSATLRIKDPTNLPGPVNNNSGF